MTPITAKPPNKAEMIRLAKATDPSISDQELAIKVSASVQQVRQALRSQGVPLKKGLRA